MVNPALITLTPLEAGKRWNCTKKILFFIFPENFYALHLPYLFSFLCIPWGTCTQGSISSTCLHARRSQKCKKDRQVIGRKKVDRLVVLLYFSRYVLYAMHSSLMKFTPGVNFINVFMCGIYARRSQKRKKLLELTVFLRFWDLLA